MDDPKFINTTTHMDKTQRPASPAPTQRQEQRQHRETERQATERASLTPKLYSELAWLCSPFLTPGEDRANTVPSPTLHKGTALDSLNPFRK